MLRPISCPGCKRMVMRPPSQVNNRVVCPKCHEVFCWLCLSNAIEKDVGDHFDRYNLSGCPGWEYLDALKNEKSCCCKKILCRRLRLFFVMPWWNIYGLIVGMIRSILSCLNQNIFCGLRFTSLIIIFPIIFLVALLQGLLISWPYCFFA